MGRDELFGAILSASLPQQGVPRTPLIRVGGELERPQSTPSRPQVSRSYL